MMVRHDSGVAEVVKAFHVPDDFDLLQVHLDDLAEINHLVEDSGRLMKHIIPSHVELVDRTAIVRRPYIETTLEDLFLPITTENKGKVDLLLDGRILDDYEVRWIAQQLVDAGKALHEEGLYHGSLHPGNVLIDSSLTIFLSDLAPFKPLAFQKDDPTVLGFFYQDHHYSYLAPERFGLQQRPSLEDRQRSDVYALGVILEKIFGIDAKMDELVQSRSLEHAPIFVSPTTTAHFLDFKSRNMFSDFDKPKFDLNDQDFAHISCRYLIGTFFSLKTDVDRIKVLALLRSCLPVSPGENLTFYLESVRKSDVSDSLKCIIDTLLKRSALHTETKPFSLRTESVGLLLRSIQSLTSSWNEEGMKMYYHLLYPAVLVHPSELIRRAGLRLLTKISNQKETELEQMALINSMLASVLASEPGIIDPIEIDFEELQQLIEPPLSLEIFHMLLRQLDQLPRFTSALSSDDARKVRMLLPILPDQIALKIIPVLTRKKIGCRPTLYEAGSEAFSPILSSVDSLDDYQTVYEIPLDTSPAHCRHFQRRSLPFQFSVYSSASASEHGEYFALMGSNGLEVWRSSDFRKEILPEPWFVLSDKDTSCIDLAFENVCRKTLATIEIYDLKRKMLIRELESHLNLNMVKITECGVVGATDFGLDFYDHERLVWKSADNPSYHGIIKHLIIGKGDLYAVTGSSEGYLSLWDLRYGLCLRSWRLPLLLTTIHQMSILFDGKVQEEEFIDPPKLCVTSSLADKPVVLVVDLALAQVKSSPCVELTDAELLEDQPYISSRPNERKLAIASTNTWILAGEKFEELACFSRIKDNIETTDLRLGKGDESIKTMCVINPTSSESSKNLSLLILTLSGTCFILECFKS